MNERVLRAHLVARVHLAHEPDFALGKVEVRPARREIAGGGYRDTIDPRVMRVLVALARAKGEILSRDDLIESCWDGVIVGEDAITRCISRLRAAAETSGNAFSIETVPRVGYRLITADAAAVEAKERATSEQTPAQTAPISGFARNASTVTVALILLALGAGGTGLWLFWPSPVHVQGSTASLLVAPANSVAVLPFANMSGDAGKEYFSDGFSQELINDLSNDPRLRVVARTSSFAFKGKNDNIGTIARALHVSAVVEGSVREVGNRVRITAQLVNAADGYRIWSAAYDRNLTDILSVQDEVAGAIAVALTHKLAATVPRNKVDPAIYRLYLKANQQYDQLDADGRGKALALLEKVTTMQPDFADGFARLSVTALTIALNDDSAHADHYVAIATEAAQKALTLDPHSINSRKARATLALHSWDWSGASSEFRALRDENPNNPGILYGLRNFYILMGFPDEAMAVMRRVRSLDPLSHFAMDLSLDYLVEYRYQSENMAVARQTLARWPNDTVALDALCKGYIWKGQIAEARSTELPLRHTRLEFENNTLPTCDFEINLETGNTAEASKLIAAQIEKFPDKFSDCALIAMEFVELHDFDKASDWFERAYDRRELAFLESIYWPGGVKYRTTPRWQQLAQQPMFKEWQAEHDRIAAELKARGGPI